MYIATDKAVLNPDLTVPERVTMMSIIPNNEPRTNMGGRQHLILFLNSNPANGSLHLASTIDASAPIWIGLYEGNGVDLVDSVTIPMGLNANTTYARQKDGSSEWEIKATDAATPGIENYIQVTESKVQQIKRNDPHGFGITILSMGIVFSCLALLWIFFTIFGKIMGRKSEEKHAIAKAEHKKRLMAAHDEDDEDERSFPGIVVKHNNQEDPDIIIAVISMAIKEYLDDTHDVESGIITIMPKENTKWTRT
jgi:Na+-transporting methylmalonyl-CoA/oxaloacetate decarboxylase gamma subunit